MWYSLTAERFVTDSVIRWSWEGRREVTSRISEDEREVTSRVSEDEREGNPLMAGRGVREKEEQKVRVATMGFRKRFGRAINRGAQDSNLHVSLQLLSRQPPNRSGIAACTSSHLLRV